MSEDTYSFLKVQFPLQVLGNAVYGALALARAQDLLANMVLRDRARKRAAAGEEVLERHGRVRLRLVHDRRLVCDLVDRDRRVDRLPVNSCTRVSDGVGI